MICSFVSCLGLEQLMPKSSKKNFLSKVTNPLLILLSLKRSLIDFHVKCCGGACKLQEYLNGFLTIYNKPKSEYLSEWFIQ